MTKFTCPSCGAEIAFRSSVSVYAVCASCGSTVVRHDQAIEAMGKMAQLPADVSPIQIGTEGIYNKMHFSVAGRTRIGWSDGAWNEWFIVTDKGSRGWLAEAQGFFAVSMEENFTDSGTDAELPFPFSTPPILDSVVILHNSKFRVTDIKEAICLGAEGELPFMAPQGRKATYVDMISDKGLFASIEYSAEQPRMYYGAYVDFETLGFSNLRDLEGWKKPVHGTNTVGDPKTGRMIDG